MYFILHNVMSVSFPDGIYDIHSDGMSDCMSDSMSDGLSDGM